jgi:hypothetical protein
MTAKTADAGFSPATRPLSPFHIRVQTAWRRCGMLSEPSHSFFTQHGRVSLTFYRVPLLHHTQGRL